MTLSDCRLAPDDLSRLGFALARRLHVRGHDAEDAAAEFALAAVEAAAKARPDGNPRSYIIASAHGRTRHWAERERRRRAQCPASLDAPVDGTDGLSLSAILRDPRAPSPDAALLRREAGARAAAAVARLPHRQRLAIRRVVGGATQGQVARELGVSRQTLCKALSRARTRLKQALAND